MKRPFDTILLTLASVVLAFFTGGALAEIAPPRPNTLIVAVTPQRSATAINNAWSPILAALESTVGVRLQLRAYESKERFDTDVQMGIPDLVYLNPDAVVLARHANGYTPIIRDTQPLTGILLVPEDSPIQRVEDLEGRTIAFPWETAFASSIYLNMMLRDKLKIGYTVTYAGNHQNVYRRLLLGEADAGGSVPNILAKESVAMRSRLRTIYSTPDLPPHAIAMHPRISKALAGKFQLAILQLAQTAEGRAMLESINIPSPLMADYARDYAALEKFQRAWRVNPAPRLK